MYLNQSCKSILQIPRETFPLGWGRRGRKHPKRGKDKTGSILPTQSSSSNKANALLKTSSPESHRAVQLACLREGQQRDMRMAAYNQGKLFNPRVISICSWLATLPEPDPMFSALQVYCLMVRSWQNS